MKVQGGHPIEIFRLMKSERRAFGLMQIPNLCSSNSKKPDALFLLHTLSTQGDALLSPQLLWVKQYLSLITLICAFITHSTNNPINTITLAIYQIANIWIADSMISATITIKAIWVLVMFIFTHVASSAVIVFLTRTFATLLRTNIRVINCVISEALTIMAIPFFRWIVGIVESIFTENLIDINQLIKDSIGTRKYQH